MQQIYLDYNATTPVDEEVLEAMLPYYRDAFGNPSSAHTEGRAARVRLDQAREQVAELRRGLPPGPAVQDYVFREGPADLTRNDPADFFDTRLSDLFPDGCSELLVQHLMFAPDWERGCQCAACGPTASTVSPTT